MHLNLTQSLLMIFIPLSFSIAYAFIKRNKKIKLSKLNNSHSYWEKPSYFSKVLGLFISGNVFQTLGLSLFLAAGLFNFYGDNVYDFSYTENPDDAWYLGTPPYETFSWGFSFLSKLDFAITLNIVNGALWLINIGLIYNATHSWKKTFKLEILVQICFVLMFGPAIDVFKIYLWQPLFHTLNLHKEAAIYSTRIAFWIIGAFLTMFGIACFVRSKVALAPYETLSVTLSDYYSIPFSKSRIILEITWALTGALMAYLGTYKTAEMHGFEDMLVVFSIGTMVFGLSSGIVISKLEHILTKTLKLSRYDSGNWFEFAVKGKMRISHKVFHSLETRDMFKKMDNKELVYHIVNTVEKTTIAYESLLQIYVPTNFAQNEIFVIDKPTRQIVGVKTLSKQEMKDMSKLRVRDHYEAESNMYLEI